MGDYSFKLPDIGEGIAEAEIAQWHVAVGDRVEEDATLVDVLTDKAAVDISSPVSGTVAELYGAVGDKVAVGAPLIRFSVDKAPSSTEGQEPPEAPASRSPSPAEQAQNDDPQSSQSQPVVSAASQATRKVLASPAVRKRAKELGLDLHQLPGTGPQGRIRQADIDAAQQLPSPQSMRPQQATTLPAFRPPQNTQPQPVIGLRRRIAQAMTSSYQRIPHFSYVEDVDVTELQALRQKLNELDAGTRPKLSFLPFIARALNKVLAEYPQANAAYDAETEQLYVSSAVHLGIATQTEQALLVPVLANAQNMGIYGLARGIATLVDKARQGKCTRDELQGSTITITSLGKLGGLVSTPIINAPEVAIIGVNKVRTELALVDGEVRQRQKMNLSSSFDHRIVDGHQAASLIQALKRELESPLGLIVDD
nr:2-oxo acid dehydrogenase subunit E2 [Oceanococcus sp. HetDA_MAG_MS8]